MHVGELVQLLQHVGAQGARVADSYLKSIQHNYIYILPSIPTTIPTTSADPLPAKPASPPPVQVILPVHLDPEVHVPPGADDGGIKLPDIPRSVG